MISRTLDEMCNITTGKLDANQAVPTGAFPFYTCAEHPNTIDSFAFDDDVVLIAGNNAGGNFHVNRYNGKFNAYQRTYVLTAKQGACIDYVYYVLKLELRRLKERAQGSQTKFLTMPILTGINFNDIDFDAQKAISQVLASIDKKIELNNKINTELEAVAKLIYDYWFVQFDFPDANGKPYKSSGGKMVYNEELKREIPDGWTNGILSDLGEVVGGSTPSTKNADNFSENGMPWITPKDLSENVGSKFISCGKQDVSDDGVKSASLKIYPKDTVLLSSRAPIGYMAIANGELTTNQGFKSFIPNKGFESSFIFYSVKNSMKTIIQYSSGSTFKEVSGSTLKTVKISLPKIETTKSYSNKMKCIFERQRLLEEKSKKLSELRDWLLPMLMNGQVTVKDS